MRVSVSLALAATLGCGRAGFDERSPDAAVEVDGDNMSPSPLSCSGLATTCGLGGAPCCESPAIPGGTYAQSYDVAGDGQYATSTFSATVSAFRLDKYEVTVGRFRQFVAAGQGTQASPPQAGSAAHPRIAASGWDPSWNVELAADPTALVAAVKCNAASQTWTDTPGTNESRPMNCITWFEAAAFCAWDGGFLPTEAEWNYAAAGGDEQRAFPWSSPPGSLAVDETHASWNCAGDGVAGCTSADLLVVGTKPAGDGRWGQSDLGGNVWEWTLDFHRSPYANNPCLDCADLTPSQDYGRQTRGGAYYSDSVLMRTGFRYSFQAPTRVEFIGVRCARTP